jgi:hypothetical protein
MTPCDLGQRTLLGERRWKPLVKLIGCGSLRAVRRNLDNAGSAGRPPAQADASVSEACRRA